MDKTDQYLLLRQIQPTTSQESNTGVILLSQAIRIEVIILKWRTLIIVMCVQTLQRVMATPEMMGTDIYIQHAINAQHFLAYDTNLKTLTNSSFHLVNENSIF